MTIPSVLAFASGVLSLILGLAGVVRQPRKAAQWSFAAGMVLLAMEATFAGLSLDAILPETIVYWQNFRLLAMAFLPGVWLLFSLSYSRGNQEHFLVKGRPLLIAAFVVPVLLVLWPGEKLITEASQTLPTFNWMLVLGWPGVALFAVFLVSAVGIVTNLERTLRASVGTMRWRVKFMVLGLGLLFAVRIYASSQSLLYSAINLSLEEVTSIALLLAGSLISVALFRDGLFNVDVYPSQRLLQNSLTVVLAGAYLLIVGLLAKVVTFFGDYADFPLKSFFVLLSLVGLTALLLSDKIRQHINRFVVRHFRRPHHDYRQVWTTFTERTTTVMDKADLSLVVAKWVSETFQVLSATVWLVEEGKRQLTYGASTSLLEGKARFLTQPDTDAGEMIQAFRVRPHPLQLEEAVTKWADALKRENPALFHSGGNPLLVPMVGRGEFLGLMVLQDRVGRVPFSVEDMDLLKCIGDQVAANLLNIQLSQKLLEGKEMEAFQAMSAFFVHDLKNTASTLSLMLQNLPVHFDDPTFREDALRALAKSVARVNELISRLSLLRQHLEMKPTESDLNEVVCEALASLNGLPQVTMVKSMPTMPKVLMDAEQIQKVVVNLLANAIDAVGENGQVSVATGTRPGWAVLSIADNGCGMSPEFLARSLFRPFQTTKKKGIGIGMFLSKMIVEAHRGRMEVESIQGKGTTFRMLLPGKG